MEEAAQVALMDDHTSFMTALAKNLDPVACPYVFEEVELYIKGMDRLRLLKAFEGHRVHVFGGGIGNADWKKLLKKHSNLIVHPSVSYDQALEIMKQSKIVLNSSIKNKQGAHERIFTASACGAVVVTNDNPLLREYFKDGEMVFYQENNLNQLDSIADKLLKNEKYRSEIAAAGRGRVMQEHTWDHRVHHLLSQITLHLKKIKRLKP
jgi:spore maturation protein CgeB